MKSLVEYYKETTSHERLG